MPISTERSGIIICFLPTPFITNTSGTWSAIVTDHWSECGKMAIVWKPLLILSDTHRSVTWKHFFSSSEFLSIPCHSFIVPNRACTPLIDGLCPNYVCWKLLVGRFSKMLWQIEELFLKFSRHVPMFCDIFRKQITG